MAHGVDQQPDQAADQRAVDSYELQVAADLAFDLDHELVRVPFVDPVFDELPDRGPVLLDEGGHGLEYLLVDPALDRRILIQLLSYRAHQPEDRVVRARAGITEIGRE